MRIRQVLSAGLLLMLFSSAPAAAVSLRDIIELTKAGLGEDVLLALIEVDRTIYVLTPAQILELKQVGVTERVIVAMIRSARTPALQPEAVPVATHVPPATPLGTDPNPQVIVIDHHDDRPQV